MLVVSDTGVGIPKDNLERIFEPFYTTKHAGEGSGLGLAIVQQIVNIHNGSISVDSTPGKGTTFTVTLPISQEKRQKQESDMETPKSCT